MHTATGIVTEGLQKKLLMQFILQDDSMFIYIFEHVVYNITWIRRHVIKLRHLKKKKYYRNL